jgi:organic hydroperoxide reductase OsmC/OhrA
VFITLELSSEATVDRVNGVTRFTEIVLRPRLTLAPGTDRARALWVLEKSKKACLVTASLSAPVRLEPDIAAA